MTRKIQVVFLAETRFDALTSLKLQERLEEMFASLSINPIAHQIDIGEPYVTEEDEVNGPPSPEDPTNDGDRLSEEALRDGGASQALAGDPGDERSEVGSGVEQQVSGLARGSASATASTEQRFAWVVDLLTAWLQAPAGSDPDAETTIGMIIAATDGIAPEVAQRAVEEFNLEHPTISSATLAAPLGLCNFNGCTFTPHHHDTAHSWEVAAMEEANDI